jgi:hypothetical protein
VALDLIWLMAVRLIVKHPVLFGSSQRKLLHNRIPLTLEPDTGNWKPETRNPTPETGNRKPERGAQNQSIEDERILSGVQG